jgi:hypothetical protein
MVEWELQAQPSTDNTTGILSIEHNTRRNRSTVTTQAERAVICG